jgi:hypothetical protein
MASHEGYAVISVFTCPIMGFWVSVGKKTLRQDSMNEPYIIARQWGFCALLQVVESFPVNGA